MEELLENGTIAVVVVGACFVLIGVLFSVLAYFIKRSLDRADKAHEGHAKKQAQLEKEMKEHAQNMNGKPSTEDVQKVYDFTRSEIQQLRTNEITPLKADLHMTRTEFIKQINQLRDDIREDIRSYLTLLTDKINKQ